MRIVMNTGLPLMRSAAVLAAAFPKVRGASEYAHHLAIVSAAAGTAALRQSP